MPHESAQRVIDRNGVWRLKSVPNTVKIAEQLRQISITGSLERARIGRHQLPIFHVLTTQPFAHPQKRRLMGLVVATDEHTRARYPARLGNLFVFLGSFSFFQLSYGNKRLFTNINEYKLPLNQKKSCEL